MRQRRFVPSALLEINPNVGVGFLNRIRRGFLPFRNQIPILELLG
jgi:hypothetical protein